MLPYGGMAVLTWELLGAVVGAGLASGKEIASFFTQYGTWGTVGVLLAPLTMICLTGTDLPVSWRDKWPEKAWKLLLSVLLLATGAAMLAGSDVVASLLLPFQHAGRVGTVLTFLLAWLLAYHTRAGLAWVSRILFVLLVLLLLLGLCLPPMKAVVMPSACPAIVVAKACAYGGFNAALQTAILRENASCSSRKMGSVRWAGCILLMLLLVGHAVLLRHPALLPEPMPFVQLTSFLGDQSYYLGLSGMYLAILSTLTACLRSLKKRFPSLLCMVVLSLFGFSGVVDAIYPLLGTGCLLWLVAAKFTNCIGIYWRQ